MIFGLLRLPTVQDTHDVGGYPEGAQRDSRKGFGSLRMQRPLEPGKPMLSFSGAVFPKLDPRPIVFASNSNSNLTSVSLCTRSLAMVAVWTRVAGMVLTVEPGVYFVDYLLDELMSEPATRSLVVAEKLNAFRGFGGIRLEDSVLVTAEGHCRIC